MEYIVCKGETVAAFLTAALILFISSSTSNAEQPLASYENIEDINAMIESLRKSKPGWSFSRDWWKWDRLRCKYVDEGRKDRNALKILCAVFQDRIIDCYKELEKKGEEDLFFIFMTTCPVAGKSWREKKGFIVGDRIAKRELHGGGFHGGWGGASRMRIYEELVRQNMLTEKEQTLFKKIVFQSLSKRFIDKFSGWRGANNHHFGNVGGPAIAVRLFPDMPRAEEIRNWMNALWGDLAELRGGWKEWTYYPYGPIFLHGMIDLAEELGKFEDPESRRLIYAIGQRCLEFVHGGGVRGNPNSSAISTKSRERLEKIYRNPWQVGYYKVEQSARDGHFWYRMAKHFKDPEFLWASVQVNLGGRPPDGKVPSEWQEAYDKRYRWFKERDIEPKVPEGKSSIGYLSPLKHKIPERLYLCSSRQSGKPFASYFIYNGKGGHLNAPEVWGTMYEYCVDGAKLLGSEGKYTDDIPGGSGAYDSLMVTKPDLQFPIDGEGPMRSGRLDDSFLRAENQGDDSFGQFGFTDYFGKGSRWTRQAVLTQEGYLVVRDVYEPGENFDGWQAGPCWLLRPDPGWNKDNQPYRGPTEHNPRQNWFDAPAWDYAWWQNQKKRLLVYIHPTEDKTFGVYQHRTSPDISRVMGFEYYPTQNSYAKATVKANVPEVFLTVLIPHDANEKIEKIIESVNTSIDSDRNANVRIGKVEVQIDTHGTWIVKR